MKKKVIIICSILLIIVLGFVLYPFIVNKIELDKMEKEVLMVNQYLKNKNVDVKSELAKDITTGKRKELEEKIELYLNDVIKNVDELRTINDDNIIDKLNNKDSLKETIDSLNERHNHLEEIKVNMENLLNKEEIEMIKDNDYKEIYDKMISKIEINDYLDKVKEELDNNKDKIETVNYLNKYKNNWQINNEKVVFLKRSNFDEWNKSGVTTLSYELVNDQKGPTITASDITIYKGNKINIKDKVKCVDDVDDKVECQVSGSYDVNKIGSYNVKISASDKAKNNSSKNIKLIVKEKKVNMKPYYIEVIRNHNVVIVYGLDSNNQYTKIVKVFICSVGINGKTPTGTFKTSDKSSWGWLVGNVYGQYYTRITGSILFHSVPYYKKAKDQLEWEEYNKLGTAASKGCVRMTVRDVKWIYNNCPSGTTVKIYDGDLPKGVSKPNSIKIDGTSPNKGWDPTDPDKNNPWNK